MTESEEDRPAEAVCLLSAPEGTDTNWLQIVKDAIKKLGLEQRAFDASRVQNAAALVAYLRDTEEEPNVIAAVAFALGRNLPVVIIAAKEDQLPKLVQSADGCHIVTIPMDALHGDDDLRNGLNGKLEGLASAYRSRSAARTGTPAQRRKSPTDSLQPSFDVPGRGGRIDSVQEAEQLFNEMVLDGLSEGVMRRLLLEAGCKKTWVELRLAQHFHSGW